MTRAYALNLAYQPRREILIVLQDVKGEDGRDGSVLNIQSDARNAVKGWGFGLLWAHKEVVVFGREIPRNNRQWNLKHFV